MKKTLIRIMALLMALSCAITLFGCQEEEDSIRRKKSKKKDRTEEVMDYEQTVGFEEETEQAWGEKVPEQSRDEKVDRVEVTTAPPLVEQLPEPGNIQLPAVDLMEYSYATLTRLRWDSSETENGEKWIFRAESWKTSFTFVFEGDYKNPDAKPIVLTVDDLEEDGFAYITQNMQINDDGYRIPDELLSDIDLMDGGLCATCILNGYNTNLLFVGEIDKVDDAVLYCVQMRREG